MRALAVKVSCVFTFSVDREDLSFAMVFPFIVLVAFSGIDTNSYTGRSLLVPFFLLRIVMAWRTLIAVYLTNLLIK